MSEPVWAEPPPPAQNRDGRPSKWVRALAPLMAHPKRWAMVCSYGTAQGASSVARALRKPNGTKGACITPEGEWEFAARKRGPAGSELYARYLGNGDDAA